MKDPAAWSLTVCSGCAGSGWHQAQDGSKICEAGCAGSGYKLQVPDLRRRPS